jgi:hypothetical protein
MVFPQKRGIVVAFILPLFLLPTGCGDPVPDKNAGDLRGPRAVCERMRSDGASIEEWTQESGYACRTKTEGNTITVTASSPPSYPSALAAVRLEGSYARGSSGVAIKEQMQAAAGTLFGRLNMDVPPGMGVAIQTQSRSEVEAGRLRVEVEHHCGTAETKSEEECRITIHVRNSGPHARSQYARFDR